jgi:hypothetical protein
MSTFSARYIEVAWHNKPVFISGLSVTMTKQELGFQIYTNTYLESKGIAEFWYHPAGENRGSGIYGLRAGLFAKRSGQRKGLPDWLNFGRKMAIELKMPKGAVSEDQVRWLAYFKAIGWYVEVVRSFERFREVVECSETNTTMK